MLGGESGNKNKKGFAFVVHSRDITDLYRKYPVAKFLPKFAAELFCKYKKPLIVSKITGLKSKITGEEIPGWIIACPITAKQMLQNRLLAHKRIFQAVKLAEKKGAAIVGLGALTASLTRGGNDIAERFLNIKVTSGHTGTAYSVTTTVKEILKTLSKKLDVLDLAIVGAAGSIGSVSARILAKENFRNILLVDVHRKRQNVIELKKEINAINSSSNIRISCNIEDIKNYDVIVAATSSPEVVILPKHLKNNAVIVNDAQPSDVSPKIYSERKDVVILEGGVINTECIDCHFNMGLASRKDVFSCLAEVMALVSMEKTEFCTLGKVSEARVFELEKMFNMLNFRIAKFQNIKGFISLN